MAAVIQNNQREQNLRSTILEINNNNLLDENDKNLQRQQLFCAPCTPLASISKSSQHDFSLSCQHYVKNCSKFFFECCQVYDPCHRCHQARGCQVKPPRISKISCSLCDVEQSPSQYCVNSACIAHTEGFSKSHCQSCMLWTQAQIHHCDACGFCRIGSKDSLYHCHNCEACFIQGSNQHFCSKVPLSEAVCPCCLDPIHTAQLSSRVLPNCGHVLHLDCMKESLKNKEYRCPTCRKSMVDMSANWKRRKSIIESNPIPSNFFVYREGEIVICPTGKFRIISIEKTNVLLNQQPVQETIVEQTNEDFEMELDEDSDLLEELDNEITDNSDSTSASHQHILNETTQPSMLTNVYYGEELDVILGYDVSNNCVYSKKSYTGYDLTLLPLSIGCHDCGQKSQTSFHYYGLECKSCSSFNTFQL